MMHRPRTAWRIVPLVILAVVAAACGTSDTDSTSAAVDAASTTVVVTTQPTTATTQPSGPPYEVTVESDVPYQRAIPPSQPLLVDIWAPEAAGPWPVVITYHPYSVWNSKWSMSRLAKQLAENGAVVFNVNYGSTTEADYDRVARENGSCSYWYTVKHAARFGGDPDDITMVGFSGGADTAADIAMRDENDAMFCFADVTEIDPTALVLFEGDWMWFPYGVDGLAADPETFRALTVWEKIDTYEGGPIHLVEDRATAGAPLYTVAADEFDEFMVGRDPDGTLQARIIELGLHEDGFDVTEFGVLFHDRLAAAGKDTTITWTDTISHTMTQGVMDAITKLVLGVEPAA